MANMMSPRMRGPRRSRRGIQPTRKSCAKRPRSSTSCTIWQAETDWLPRRSSCRDTAAAELPARPRSKPPIQAVDAVERREQLDPEAGDGQRGEAAEDDGQDGADEPGDGARLEGAELVGGADEDHLHGGHAAEHGVRRGQR